MKLAPVLRRSAPFLMDQLPVLSPVIKSHHLSPSPVALTQQKDEHMPLAEGKGYDQGVDECGAAGGMPAAKNRERERERVVCSAPPLCAGIHCVLNPVIQSSRP